MGQSLESWPLWNIIYMRRGSIYIQIPMNSVVWIRSDSLNTKHSRQVSVFKQWPSTSLFFEPIAKHSVYRQIHGTFWLYFLLRSARYTDTNQTETLNPTICENSTAKTAVNNICFQRDGTGAQVRGGHDVPLARRAGGWWDVKGFAV